MSTLLFSIKNRVLYTKLYQESTKVGLVNSGGMGKGTDTWNSKPKNIYNGDETGLFFRLPPNRTLCLKGDICKGRKNCKDKLTVLLACSANRTDKLLPLITGVSETVIDFKMSLSCPQNTRSVNKVMRLIQYNSVLTFKLQIEFVPFKIVPSGDIVPTLRSNARSR